MHAHWPCTQMRQQGLPAHQSCLETGHMTAAHAHPLALRIKPGHPPRHDRGQTWGFKRSRTRVRRNSAGSRGLLGMHDRHATSMKHGFPVGRIHQGLLPPTSDEHVHPSACVPKCSPPCPPRTHDQPLQIIPSCSFVLDGPSITLGLIGLPHNLWLDFRAELHQLSKHGHGVRRNADRWMRRRFKSDKPARARTHSNAERLVHCCDNKNLWSAGARTTAEEVGQGNCPTGPISAFHTDINVPTHANRAGSR